MRRAIKGVVVAGVLAIGGFTGLGTSSAQAQGFGGYPGGGYGGYPGRIRLIRAAAIRRLRLLSRRRLRQLFRSAAPIRSAATTIRRLSRRRVVRTGLSRRRIRRRGLWPWLRRIGWRPQHQPGPRRLPGPAGRGLQQWLRRLPGRLWRRWLRRLLASSPPASPGLRPRLLIPSRCGPRPRSLHGLRGRPVIGVFRLQAGAGFVVTTERQPVDLPDGVEVAGRLGTDDGDHGRVDRGPVRGPNDPAPSFSRNRPQAGRNRPPNRPGQPPAG